MLIKKKIPKENKKVAFSDIKYSLLLHVCGDIRKPFHIYILILNILNLLTRNFYDFIWLVWMDMRK